MEIVIGSGNYIVSGVSKGHIEGVRIGLLREHGHEIDTNADDMVGQSTEFCAILFTDLKSARMFQDQINAACMRMNGYVVKNNNAE